MKEIVIDNKTFTNYVADICRQIELDNWRPDYVVGIGRGGATPAVLISQYFDVPYHSVGLHLHTHKNTEHNAWIAVDAIGETGTRKNILVVDDIVESGDTLNWIVDDWQSACMPASDEWDDIWNNTVRFAVVIDNTASEFCKNIDYCGSEINEHLDDYLITFPITTWWKS